MSGLYIFLLVCLAAGTSTWSLSLPETRIVGLKNTAHISKFPYEVSVRRKLCQECAFEHYCGGAIYSRNAILTAATCVQSVEQLLYLQVVAGTSYREGAAIDGSIFHVASIARHDDPNIDIAIIHLATDIPLDGFRMKALPIAMEQPSAGKMAVVAGWGQESEYDANSEELREIAVPIMQQEECKRVYSWTTIRDHEICAGYTAGGVDACQGDAGSPLLMNNQMVGLVSWGFGCARTRSPGVYTNVVQLREWIESQVE